MRLVTKSIASVTKCKALEKSLQYVCKAKKNQKIMKKIRKNSLFRTSFILLIAVSFYACEKDKPADPVLQVGAAEVLDCNAFSSNITLIDHPDRPIDYIINCKMPVSADIIISPGVVIAFDQNAGINIRDNSASFIAEGTADKPIIFTGLKQVKGYWSGIFSDNSNPLNSLKYCTVEYAGGGGFSGGDGNVMIYAGGALKIDHCIIRRSADVGLRCNYRDAELSSTNSVYTENEAPMNIEDALIGIPNSTDDYRGNVTDRILLRHYSSPILTTTAKKINVPYRFTGGISGVTEAFTVEPGVEFEMAAGSGIAVSENYGKGGIKMVGTAANPIKIYGMLNVPGSWTNIYIEGTNPMNEIAYVSISHGGQSPSTTYGVVRLWYNALLNIHDVTFTDTKAPACAIAYRLLGGQTTNPNLTSSNLTLVNTDCESKVH
jgi:hypothetical protein